jgi:transposase
MRFVGHRFRTDPRELEALWAKLPAETSSVTVVMEPTRNAWVPLASWFRRKGAAIVLVPAEQSADLRAYYSKHAKTDRLDSRILARLPLLHPDGLHNEETLGPGGPLKRAVKIRSGLVHRRSTAMHRLDALLELLGPRWTAAIGTDMTLTALRFLAKYASPIRVRRLGERRLAEFFQRSSRAAWGTERAAAVTAAARATIELWGEDGMDFEQLAEDIAIEARLALGLTEEIKALDKRIAAHYAAADPKGIVRSAPGVGVIGAPQILGRLGDPARFSSLAGVRSFSGLVPRQASSGLNAQTGGPTKAGDACLREALFICADHARKIDPTLAARYHRLMATAGKHHNSALCTIAAVLLTRIAACVRAGAPYDLQDIDGRPISEAEGRRICAERYQVPAAVRVARRSLGGHPRRQRRNERAERGVAERSEAPPVPRSA